MMISLKQQANLRFLLDKLSERTSLPIPVFMMGKCLYAVLLLNNQQLLLMRLN